MLFLLDANFWRGLLNESSANPMISRIDKELLLNVNLLISQLPLLALCLSEISIIGSKMNKLIGSYFGQ